MEIIVYPDDIKKCLVDAFQKGSLTDIITTIGDSCTTMKLIQYNKTDAMVDNTFITLINASKDEK